MTDFLQVREEMLRSKGIKGAEPLTPAVSCKGVNHYTQKAFGRLRKEVEQRSGIKFKWKDYRPTGGQIPRTRASR